ncbi:MAG: imidazole glycerol phosphate synthase subunit HisH [Planctomycetes bacterium]|nr:imidazole glycerol phosphate synthase subunit HisH [Planctomycetota bacterium]
MIAIVDYGMGNLRSVAKAIELIGGRAKIVDTAEEILSAQKLILPGVGAFGDAMENLRRLGLIEPIKLAIAEGRPFLGICLGLQLLFGVGHEDGRHAGLDVLGGAVVRFDFSSVAGGEGLAIPHMGWNTIHWQRDCPLFRGLESGVYVYFVHSYHVVPEQADIEATSTRYGYAFTSSIWSGNMFATQFHPEKSQSVGLKMMANFVGL